MREIYKSPRQENIDRVVTLMTEHGIETAVNNRSCYDRASYSRYRYSARGAGRQRWPAVEVVRAQDLTPARQLLRDIGVEPLNPHSDLLAEARYGQDAQRRLRDLVAKRARMWALVAVVVVVAVIMARYLHVF